MLEEPVLYKAPTRQLLAAVTGISSTNEMELDGQALQFPLSCDAPQKKEKRKYNGITLGLITTEVGRSVFHTF